MTGQRGNRAQTSLLSPTKRHPGKLGKAVMSFAAALARAQHQALERDEDRHGAAGSTATTQLSTTSASRLRQRPSLVHTLHSAHTHSQGMALQHFLYVCVYLLHFLPPLRPPTTNHQSPCARDSQLAHHTACDSFTPLRAPPRPPRPQSFKILCATHTATAKPPVRKTARHV